jgi:RNA polymerase sigma-70 factor, ECF subfamily
MVRHGAVEAEQRYRLLFERHWRRVLAYAARRAPDAATAEDVVAEVFLVAWRRIDEVPSDCELAWLLGVARRVLANSRRSLQRRERLIEHVGHNITHLQMISLQHDRDTSSADDQRVIDALSRMRRADAEVLRLTAWEGLSHDEIAVVLNCSVNAVAVRGHRARKRLEQLLVERIDGEVVKAERDVGHRPVMPGTQT